MKILVADGEPDVVEVFRLLLQKELSAVEIHGAGTYEAAQKLLAANQYDWVLLGDCFSYGTTCGILEIITRAHLPARVVVMTAGSAVRMEEEALPLGAEKVFHKALELDEIISYISRGGIA